MAPAYVNLARLNFLEQDFPGAESLLGKALNLAPAANADELFLLAYAQISDNHLDEAIATSREGHGMQLKQHAYLHLVAARACERENRIADSISELQSYLNEEPSGTQAEKVRTAMATLQAQVANQ
jgi:tetratricopeptide (TPR) repeat protein